MISIALGFEALHPHARDPRRVGRQRYRSLCLEASLPQTPRSAKSQLGLGYDGALCAAGSGRAAGSDRADSRTRARHLDHPRDHPLDHPDLRQPSRSGRHRFRNAVERSTPAQRQRERKHHKRTHLTAQNKLTRRGKRRSRCDCSSRRRSVAMSAHAQHETAGVWQSIPTKAVPANAVCRKTMRPRRSPRPHQSNSFIAAKSDCSDQTAALILSARSVRSHEKPPSLSGLRPKWP